MESKEFFSSERRDGDYWTTSFFKMVLAVYFHRSTVVLAKDIPATGLFGLRYRRAWLLKK